MENYIRKLKCLSDQTRVRILRILLEAEKELCVCEIGEVLHAAVYTVSKHIKELRNAELITESKAGKFVLYRISAQREAFDETLFAMILSIPHAVFADDTARLKERLTIKSAGRLLSAGQKRKQLS